MIELPRRRRFIDDPNDFRLAYQLAAMTNAAHALEAGSGSRSTMTVDECITSRAELLEHGVDSARLVPRKRMSFSSDSTNGATAADGRGVGRESGLTPAERRLQRFLSHTVEPSAKLVLAGGATPARVCQEADDIASQVRLAGSDDLSHRAYYDLACDEASVRSPRQRQRPRGGVRRGT